MNVVYMGTPDFAVPALKALTDSEHTVLSVVTGPDKRSGRGRRVQPTPVKALALELGLKVMTPDSLKAPEFAAQLHELNADLFVVIAFRILPRKLLGIPKHGSINVHGSLLPKYRGAAPIQHALFNGETETGLSAFYLKPSVDTGDVISQLRVAIEPDDTYTTLSRKMSEQAGGFLLETIRLIETGAAKPQPQDDTLATRAPKITPADRELDWSQSAEGIVNRIRGLAEVPGAFTTVDGKRLKALAARCVDAAEEDKPAPGELVVRHKRLLAGAGDGNVVELLRLQPEGKKVMTAQEIINGQYVRDGVLIGAVQKKA